MNAQNYNGLTALTAAKQRRASVMIERLRGKLGRSGMKALHRSMKKGDTKALQELASRYGDNVFIVTTLWRHETRKISLLQDAGGRERDLRILVPLNKGDEQALARLLDRGANPDVRINYETPLIRAAKSGQTGIAGLLIEAGANIHLKDRQGNTAQDWARRMEHEDIVGMLKVVGRGMAE